MFISAVAELHTCLAIIDSSAAIRLPSWLSMLEGPLDKERDLAKPTIRKAKKTAARAPVKASARKDVARKKPSAPAKPAKAAARKSAATKSPAKPTPKAARTANTSKTASVKAVNAKPASANLRHPPAAKAGRMKPEKAPASNSASAIPQEPLVLPAGRARMQKAVMSKPVVPDVKATATILRAPAARESKAAETKEIAPAASPRPLQPKAVSTAAPRADLPPTSGFTLLVDGHFKSQYDALKRAKDAAAELLARFPMLRIEIYDAATKTRIPV